MVGFLKRESTAIRGHPRSALELFARSSHLGLSMSGTTQPFTPTEVFEQGQPLGEVLNRKITGEEAMDQRSETHDAMDVDVDMDLGEGTSEAAADLSGSDPAPSANKPRPKPAFVKIVELKEKEMLKAYVEAFFGEPYDVDWITSLMVVILANRSLHVLQEVWW